MPNYAQFTLTQLLTLFYEQLGENTAFWRTDEATRILQESFRVFNCLTGFWRGRGTTILSVTGQHFYAVPSGLTYLLRVEVNHKPLASSSLYDLDYGQVTWENDTCIAGNLPEMFAPVGFNQFALWPATAEDGDSIVCEGVVPAPDLFAMAPGAFVNLGQDELEAILDYAQHIAQFKEGGQEFEASQVQLKEFLKEAGSRNAVLMQSSRFRNWMGLTDQRKRPMRSERERVGAR